MGDKFLILVIMDNMYIVMDNIEWINGFWIGILWLCYEVFGEKYYCEVVE